MKNYRIQSENTQFFNRKKNKFKKYDYKIWL